ncbi:MAG: penicillin-binding transpeptidase domain-containing protein, partial [Cucumibacter sp.]
YNGWSPENFNGEYHGPVALRDALANSFNVVAAKLAIEVGPQNVVNTAYRLGISTPLEPVPSIALGTAAISLLDLTQAYAPFANGGIGVIAHVINRIETAEGEVLYDHIPAGPGRVVAEENVARINDMLTYAVETGTGRRADVGDWPVAGKTGTTQDFRDAVFIGYSARMVAGVWLGNDDNSSMESVGGGSLPVEVWSEFMRKAHEGYAVAALPGTYSRFAEAPSDQPAEAPRRRNIGDFLHDLFGGN